MKISVKRIFLTLYFIFLVLWYFIIFGMHCDPGPCFGMLYILAPLIVFLFILFSSKLKNLWQGNVATKFITTILILIGIGVLIFSYYSDKGMFEEKKETRNYWKVRSIMNSIWSAMFDYSLDNNKYPTFVEGPPNVKGYLGISEKSWNENNFAWMNNIGYDQYFCVYVPLQDPDEQSKIYYVVHQDGYGHSSDPCLFFSKEPIEISDPLQKEIAYKLKAIREKNIAFCAKSYTVEDFLHRTCVLEVAKVKQDPSICLNAEKEYHNACFYYYAIDKKDPSSCLRITSNEFSPMRLREKKDCFEKTGVSESFCESIDEMMSKNICYLALKDCNKIDYNPVQDICFKENIIEIYKTGFNQALYSCNQIDNEFDKEVCLQDLAKEVAKQDTQKALLLVDQVSDIDRKGIMLRLIAEETAKRDLNMAFEICNRITEKTLHSSQEECIKTVSP